MKHPHDLIEIERRCLAATDNPMHAWAAYSFARVAGEPIPDWVLGYLDLAARDLFKLAMEASAAGGKDLGPKIAKALRLDGKPRSGSPLATYHSNWKVLGVSVRDRMNRPDCEGRTDKETHAVEAVAAQHGVSASTVSRAFKLYDQLFPGEAVFPGEVVTSA